MKRALFAALISSLMVIPAIAHHSATPFDQSKIITLEGVVTKWELTNPHSWLHVEVTGKDGSGGMDDWARARERPIAATAIMNSRRRILVAALPKVLLIGIPIV